ncbi:hypothetical protein ACTXT7_002044 [Hymenolepis weldensis]
MSHAIENVSDSFGLSRCSLTWFVKSITEHQSQRRHDRRGSAVSVRDVIAATTTRNTQISFLQQPTITLPFNFPLFQYVLQSPSFEELFRQFGDQ